MGACMKIETNVPDLDVLSRDERVIYDELVRAADAGEVCPTYLDLNEIVGFDSSSASPGVVSRLQRKGFIVVERYQRSRVVTICATGAKTAEVSKVKQPHIPRGSKDPTMFRIWAKRAGISRKIINKIISRPGYEAQWRRNCFRLAEIMERREAYQDWKANGGRTM